MVGTEVGHITSKKPNRGDPIPDTLVRVELYKKNDKVFDGRLVREDLIKVWSEALRRDPNDLDGVASIQVRGRSLCINYRLKVPIVINQVFKKPEFEWEKSEFGQCDFFDCRILGLFTDLADPGEVLLAAISGCNSLL